MLFKCKTILMNLLFYLFLNLLVSTCIISVSNSYLKSGYLMLETNG
jgi:hypothetical protein